MHLPDSILRQPGQVQRSVRDQSRRQHEVRAVRGRQVELAAGGQPDTREPDLRQGVRLAHLAAAAGDPHFRVRGRAHRDRGLQEPRPAAF